MAKFSTFRKIKVITKIIVLNKMLFRYDFRISNIICISYVVKYLST